MKSVFRPTTPADRGQLASVLLGAFPGTSTGSSLLEPAVMDWKYWIPRGDWSEPRSYVLEREGRIIAHAGLWPVTFPGDVPVRGVQMIDWCSAKDSPGAGMALVQKLASMFDFMYSIGGSDMTRKVLPGLGFTEVTQAWIAARPLRPLQQILTHQHVNWKLVPRFFRNWMWSSSPSSSAKDWKIVPLEPSEIPGHLFSRALEAKIFPRPPAFFEYLLRCPAMRFQLHGIADGTGLQGYFVLGVVRGQARIACVGLINPCIEHWRAAYALAQQAALQRKDAFEIVATGSKGINSEAVRQAGLRTVTYAPVYVLNKNGRFTPPEQFQFQMSDDDAAFLDQGQVSYYT